MQAPEFRAPESKVHQRADLLKAFGARISVTGCVAIRMAVMVAVLVLLGQSAKAQVTFGAAATKSTDDQCGCNTAQTTVTLPFTIGSGSNVLLLLNVHIRSASTTSSPTVVPITGATFTPAVGPVLPFSFIQGDTFIDTTNPIKNAVRGEQWRLTQIPIGAGTITVTLTGAARFIVGAVEFFGVNPTHPIRANNTNKAESNTGSVCLPAPMGGIPLQQGDIMVDGLSTDDTAGPTPLAPQVLIYGVGTHGGSNGSDGFSSRQDVTNCPMGNCGTVCQQYDLSGIEPFVDCVVVLENAQAPSRIELQSFAAARLDGGKVIIQWDSGYEVDNLGYNVFREQRGVRTRVNPAIIAGSALLAGPGTALTAGRSYHWADTAKGKREVTYWLESIDLSGNSVWHGPIAPESKPSSGQMSTLSQTPSVLLTNFNAYQAEQEGRYRFSGPVELKANVAAASAASMSIQAVLANQPAIKIQVKQEGWYRVTQPELLAAGLSSTVNPQNFQLYVDGQELPIIVVGEADKKFDSSDAVEFYGIGVDTPYTNTRTYWLVAGSAAGKRISTTQSNATPAAGGSFSYTVERRDKVSYFTALRNGDAENFFGDLVGTWGVDEALVVQNPAASSGNATLEVSLQGVNLVSHSVNVWLNGSLVGTINLDGQSKNAQSIAVAQSLLIAGANVVHLASQGGPSDLSYVDYVRLSYDHTYRADNDLLRFSATGGQQASVAGFSNSAVRVIDITNPSAPQEIIGKVKGDTVTVTVPGTGTRTLLAFASGQVRQAAGLKSDQPSNWRSAANGADLVVITNRDLFNTIAPLKTLRQSQGLSVAVVDVEDAYDEFSFGQKTPYAVRDFLAFAKGNWKKAPRFVLLVGSASFDPRNYFSIYGTTDTDLVSTKLIDTQLEETASDDWFADFNEDGIAELAVGRLPVRTAQEASTVISKIIAYEGSQPAQGVLLIADRNDGFDFESEVASLQAILPRETDVQVVLRGETDDSTARSTVLAAINEGQKIVNYAGHGSPSVWRGNLLTLADASDLTNTSRLSMFVSMTCQNGYFVNPFGRSLAEALMTSNGGAVLMWASSAMTPPKDQAVMNEEVIRQLYSGTGSTIGEATQRAKAATEHLDVRRTWILFGDPTTRIR